MFLSFLLLLTFNAIGQDNNLSAIIGLLTEQKTIAEGCVKEINSKYHEKSINLQQYNNAKHLYLLASGSFNGLISRLISDIESSGPIHRIDYLDEVNRARARGNNFILFVNDFYRGALFTGFIKNFGLIAYWLDGISKFLPSNRRDKEILINRLNSLKWQTFEELSAI